jgi:16S rRNA C967 or C1407 C5-methylase (RsmB/RsmF family)/NOL1/NOP2/fmu family ribosome biogenesis protein
MTNSGIRLDNKQTGMNFPRDFIESIKCAPAFNEEEFILGHNLPAEISVRVNPLKPTAQFKSNDAVPWCEGAYYLKEKPQFIFDPLLHAGCYYVQEASSMFLQHALKSLVDFKEKTIVLDLCAAPGGKSTLISSLLNDQSLLVSNEVIRPRANILLENIIKWNSFNTVVTNNDPEDFRRIPEFFDVMVVDAPCSGSGLFRKDPEAMKEWSIQNVNLCTSRQKRILADALTALKPGGLLFYSTCSFSESENEEMLDWLCENFEMESTDIPLNANWKIEQTKSKDHGASGYRFYPGKVRGEGFFIAALRKKGEPGYQKKTSDRKLDAPSNAESDVIKSLLVPNENMAFAQDKNEIVLYNKSVLREISLLRSSLNVMSFGTVAGEILRGELLPAHALALSTLLNDTVDRVEVDKETAIRYLRRDEIKIAGGEKGWKLITFEKRNLGWIKSLGNRINNYYPKEWRILKRTD